MFLDPMWQTMGPPGRDGTDGIDGKDGKSVVGPKGEAGADADSLNPRGTWQRSTRYEPLDIVTHQGSSYVAVTGNILNRPSTRSKVWQLLAAKGSKGDRGEQGLATFGRGRKGEPGTNNGGGFSMTFNQDANIGQVVYLDNTGKAALALANNITTSQVLGFVIADVQSGQAGEIFTDGLITKADWALTPGEIYYLSATVSGGITNVAPTTDGEFVVPVGRAVSPITLDIEVQLSVGLSGNVTPGSQGNTPLSAIHDSATVVGQAVYVSSSDHVDLALANDSMTTGAIGIAYADTNAGEIGQFIAEGQAERSDWTTVTGQQSLVAGDTYFLSDTDPGVLTNVAPTDAGSYITVIGRALSDSVLDIEISCQILLTGNFAIGSSLTTTLETFTVTPAQAASGEIQLSADVANEQVFVNGLHQIVDEDYSLSGSLITFGVGCLRVGDIVAVKYELA